jgi:hypothetical protein
VKSFWGDVDRMDKTRFIDDVLNYVIALPPVGHHDREATR